MPRWEGRSSTGGARRERSIAGARPARDTRADWTAALDGHRPPSFEPAGHRRVTVVAAHPDDETLGASGCLQALHRAGAEVTLVVATDGEAAYPALDADARRDLARARRVELAAALRAQGLGDVACTGWDCRTPGSTGAGPRCVRRCGPCSPTSTPTLRRGPATRTRTTALRGSPPPRSRRSPRTAGPTRSGCGRGSRPDDPAVPWERARLLRLDADVLAAKQAAIADVHLAGGPGTGRFSTRPRRRHARPHPPARGAVVPRPAQRVRARVPLRRALRRRRPVAGRLVVRAAQAGRRAGEPAA